MLKPARIAARTEWADGLITLTLDLPGPQFQPGQFFNLALPEEADAITRRSYSAASAPGLPLEFLVSRVPQGELTPRLVDLSPGAALLVDDAPLGFFTLAEVPPARHLWLVATGTGLGPYLSMLRADQGLDRFERIIVVHGVTETARLAHREELEKRQSAGQVQYVPVTSRSAPPSGGLAGRITTGLVDGTLEQLTGVSIDTDSHVLLCGNPQMIEDVAVSLKGRGLAKHRKRAPGHFNFEKYW